MKIINQTQRDLDLSHQLTAVSELQPTTELKEKSLLHIVQYLDKYGDENRYESMCMEVFHFENKVYEAVQNTFKTRYLDTHCGESSHKHDNKENEDCPVGTSFKELLDYLKDVGTGETSWEPTEPNYTSPDGFVEHVYYDFDVLKRYMVKRDNYLQSQLDGIGDYLTDLDCYFDTEMVLTTTNSDGDTVHQSVANSGTVDDDHCQMEIGYGNKISNEWMVPATGNLVVYGWLDSSAALNNKAIPSSYCVIEGKINYTSDHSNWEILSVQPVIPAKTITYVGFNLLVHEGLVIRARTGFTVGAKSGQYANEQDGYDTLANITPNGFKCQVFSNKKYLTTRENELAEN